MTLEPRYTTPEHELSKPLRIAYLSTELGLGGAETVTRLLFDEWRALGHDVHLILTYEPGAIAKLMIDEGHSVTALNTPRGLRSVLTVHRVVSHITRLMPDVVVVNNQVSLLPWAWTLGSTIAAKRTPVVAVIHSSLEGPLKLGDRIHQWFLPRYDRVVVLGRPHKKYVHERFHVSDHKLLVIHNGIPNQRPRPLEAALPGLPGAAVIGVVVARLHPVKNHQMLLEATRLVLRTHPDFHLMIVGDGELRDDLQALATELGVTANVHFLGARRDVAAILNHVHIGLLSSISETFSVAVLEYMRAGLPVLATRIGSIEDEVLDGQTGLLVERHDKEGYARALALLVGDSDLRQRLGCAGRALQAQEFTSRHMSREYLNLFAHRVSALNSHPSR